MQIFVVCGATRQSPIEQARRGSMYFVLWAEARRGRWGCLRAGSRCRGAVFRARAGWRRGIYSIAVPILEPSAASAMLRPSRKRGVTRGTHSIRRLARSTMW